MDPKTPTRQPCPESPPLAPEHQAMAEKMNLDLTNIDWGKVLDEGISWLQFIRALLSRTRPS